MRNLGSSSAGERLGHKRHPGLPGAVATTDLGSELGTSPQLPAPKLLGDAVPDLAGEGPEGL